MLNVKCQSLLVCVREEVNRKKTFSFGHCPNFLTPPPWPQFGQLGPLFSDVKIQDLKVSLELRILYVLYNILYICNLKTVKSSIHWHFWRNRLFLLTKHALLKRGPKNSGRGKPPPPSFGQCPKENVFFFIEAFPYKKLFTWWQVVVETEWHPGSEGSSTWSR